MFEIFITLISWALIILVTTGLFGSNKNKKNNNTSEKPNNNSSNNNEAPSRTGRNRKSFLEQVREEYQKFQNENTEEQNTNGKLVRPKNNPDQKNVQKQNRNVTSRNIKKEPTPNYSRKINSKKRKINNYFDDTKSLSLETDIDKNKDKSKIDKSAIISSLSNKKKLQEAFVTKEILDKPVSLRKHRL